MSITRSRVKKEYGGELQSYLESFNKEIGGGTADSTANATSSTVVTKNPIAEDVDEDDEEGTYFVDQSGNYYYQATKDSEPVPSNPPEGFIEDTENEDDNEKPEVESPKKKGFNYVVIMENEDEESKEEGENNFYDYNETEVLHEEEIDVVDKPAVENGKVIKLVRKKNSTSLITASSNGQFECSHCQYSTPKRYLLARHLKTHSDDRPHKCSVCERGFKTLASWQNHLNTHTGVKPHNCKFCSSSFTTSGELVRHVRYRHTHEKPHKCTECDYASVELSKLKRHIRCHTGERPYQCPHCTYASPDTFKLKRHLRIHTGEKPYECDICQARFTQSNSLKAHKLIHSVGEKPVFQCELCPTTCGRKTDLRIHVQKLHTSEHPIKCKRCCNSFPDRYTYKVHSKTHDGEKCYKCSLCPYASISYRHLESHLLIHTDQKPYVCNKCDQAFRQKQLLRRHMNLYHNKNYVPPEPKEKNHECPHCERKFTHKGNLIRHMANHDPDSKIKETSYKLKLGRQKKVCVIDGETVEVFNNENSPEDENYEDEEEEEEEELEEEIEFDNDTMDTGNDGDIFIKEEHKNVDDNQQYVVLEVIQCEDGDEGAADNNAAKSANEIDEMEDSEYILADLQEEEAFQELTSDKGNNKDMSSCFGFDDEDVELEEEDEKKYKATIKLLNMSDDKL